MRRMPLVLFLLVTLVASSGCALREPQYSTELGGFPMYKGSSSDRAQMYQGVDYREERQRLHRKPEQSAASGSVFQHKFS